MILINNLESLAENLNLRKSDVSWSAAKAALEQFHLSAEGVEDPSQVIGTGVSTAGMLTPAAIAFIGKRLRETASASNGFATSDVLEAWGFGDAVSQVNVDLPRSFLLSVHGAVGSPMYGGKPSPGKVLRRLALLGAAVCRGKAGEVQTLLLAMNPDIGIPPAEPTEETQTAAETEPTETETSETQTAETEPVKGVKIKRSKK